MQWMRNLGTFAWVRPDPLYDFHNPISPFLLKFLLQALWFGVSFCLIFFAPTLWLLHFTSLPPPHPNDLCDGYLRRLTLCFWQNWEYMAQSQLSLKSYDVSSVKKRFRLIQCLYMTVYVRVDVMTGHCPSHGSLSFLQMRSIEEVTRGGTLLGGSYYFSITIETNTLAFSWSRPGVHWHKLSHSTSWQNPKWISALWIIPICTQFTDKMSCQQKCYDRLSAYMTLKNKEASLFYNEHKMEKHPQ